MALNGHSLRSLPVGKGPLAAAMYLLGHLVCPGGTRASETSPALVLDRTIALTGVAGRLDHMAVDLKRGRLFVAELGNGSVDVVDLASDRAVHRLTGLREPQGIGIAAGVVAVASGDDGSVRLFSTDDLSPLGHVGLGSDADDVRSDPRTGRLVVGYGDGGLAVLDPAIRSVVRRVALPAHPEGFALDPASGQAFVNVPDAGQIAVVDLAAGKQVASWRMPELRANFPMALDASAHTLATVFRNPPRLVLLDTRTGRVTASFATCGDADDVFLDAGRRRLYVSCGEGAVDVLEEGASGYSPLARVETRPGARTSLYVPELDRLFVAARAGPVGGAAILVFRPQSGTGRH